MESKKASNGEFTVTVLVFCQKHIHKKMLTQNFLCCFGLATTAIVSFLPLNHDDVISKFCLNWWICIDWLVNCAWRQSKCCFLERSNLCITGITGITRYNNNLWLLQQRKWKEAKNKLANHCLQFVKIQSWTCFKSYMCLVRKLTLFVKK